jgi:hypothetical protein
VRVRTYCGTRCDNFLSSYWESKGRNSWHKRIRRRHESDSTKTTMIRKGTNGFVERCCKGTDGGASLVAGGRLFKFITSNFVLNPEVTLSRT